MKTKLIIIITLLISLQTSAQVVNIPDPNFLYRLLNHYYIFGGVHIDTNNNGQIEVSEAEAVTELILGDAFINDNKITDMTGIEAFINLNSLQCINNQIESLDLSQNTKLEHINCQGNNISFLDVTQCSALLELNCEDNQLMNLNISNNINLDYVRCEYNQLISLTISNNTLLEKLYCGNNLLTSFNTSSNFLLKELNVSNNNLSALDVSNNLQLIHLGCMNNNLSFLDVRNGNNINFNVFIATNNNLLTCIFVDDKQYSTENWTGPLYFRFDPNSHFVETQEQCDAIGIEESIILDNLIIYPNPTYDSFTIESNVAYSKLKIYNELGVLVAEFNKQQKYSISNLKSGVYMIQLITPYTIISKKLIKN